MLLGCVFHYATSRVVLGGNAVKCTLGGHSSRQFFASWSPPTPTPPKKEEESEGREGKGKEGEGKERRGGGGRGDILSGHVF